jgi:hypothetical protein
MSHAVSIQLPCVEILHGSRQGATRTWSIAATSVTSDASEQSASKAGSGRSDIRHLLPTSSLDVDGAHILVVRGETGNRISIPTPARDDPL